jgi:copper homeostasis protein
VRKVLVEVIASSPDDCAAIQQAGADRIELCSALVLGGLTPSIGTIVVSKARVTIPIMVMIRPRAAGMAYSDGEFAGMEHDNDAAIEAGADGVVFGCLLQDGRLDTRRMAALADRCENRQTVCHRAFDVSPDAFEALESLIDMGFTRVLTSGRKPSAPEGADLIKSLIDRADGRIEILPGAGLNARNISRFIEATRCCQIHLSGFGLGRDRSGDGNPTIQFSGSEPPPEGSYDAVDGDAVRQAVAACRRY